MRLQNVYVATFFQNKNRQRWDLKMKTTDSDGNIIFDDFVTQVKWEDFKHKSQVAKSLLKMRRQSLILGREANQKVDSPVKEK